MKERAEAIPAGSWINGRNWDQSLWPGGEFPTAEVLDRAAPGRAVWLKRVDGHAGWASTEAMKLAGVTRTHRRRPAARSSAIPPATRPEFSSTVQ